MNFRMHQQYNIFFDRNPPAFEPKASQNQYRGLRVEKHASLAGLKTSHDPHCPRMQADVEARPGQQHNAQKEIGDNASSEVYYQNPVAQETSWERPAALPTSDAAAEGSELAAAAAGGGAGQTKPQPPEPREFYV